MVQAFEYVIGGILVVLAIFLVVVILMQTGKDKGLSGTLTGNTDTYFGRSGGASKDKILNTATIVGSIVFVVLAIVMTILSSVA